jgi:hypothetical protein
MRVQDIQSIRQFIFGTDDIARALGISTASARVTASRYAGQGVIVRLKPGLYMLPARFQTISMEARFRVASLLQTPSYISLTTALSYYEVSTQQQQNFIESAAVKRTKRIEIRELTFSFTRLKKELYDGFERRDDFFIALPEKALADAVYLSAMGRYACDFHAVLFDKIDPSKTAAFLGNTNYRTLKFWEKLCRNFAI